MTATPDRKPAVGDVVLVPVEPAHNNGSPVAPAVVTRVWSANCVNYRVLLDGQDVPWRTSATYVPELPQDAGSAHRWTWPPSQAS